VLKQRVLTAILLLPLVMAAIFALPAPWFMLLLAIVLMQGSIEYTRLAGLSGHISSRVLVVLQGLILLLLFWFKGHWDSGIWIYLSASCAAWLLMLARLPLFRTGTQPDRGYRAVSFITAIVRSPPPGLPLVGYGYRRMDHG